MFEILSFLHDVGKYLLDVVYSTWRHKSKCWLSANPMNFEAYESEANENQ